MQPRVSNPTKLEDYKGYIPDLLEKISQRIKRKFTLSIVGDKKYGAKTDGNKWNGMIGEIIEGVSHLEYLSVLPAFEYGCRCAADCYIAQNVYTS